MALWVCEPMRVQEGSGAARAEQVCEEVWKAFVCAEVLVLSCVCATVYGPYVLEREKEGQRGRRAEGQRD